MTTRESYVRLLIEAVDVLATRPLNVENLAAGKLIRVAGAGIAKYGGPAIRRLFGTAAPVADDIASGSGELDAVAKGLAREQLVGSTGWRNCRAHASQGRHLEALTSM